MENSIKFKVWFFDIHNKDSFTFTGTNKEWKEYSKDLQVTITKRKKVKSVS